MADHNHGPATHSCDHHHHHEHAHASAACEHGHTHGSTRGSKVGLWVAGIATAVGLGAYLLNSYGKSERQANEGGKQPERWQDRTARPPNTPQERGL